MAVMIGMTMTASTMATVRMVRPVPETGPAKSGNQPKMSPTVDVERLHEGREDGDAPEAEDDRRHGGEQVDDVAEACGEAARRVVRDEEGDADGERTAMSRARKAAQMVPKTRGPT